MIEVPAGIHQHTVARDIERIYGERQIDRHRSTAWGESPDTIAEAINHAHPNRGLIVPFDFGDGSVGRRRDVAQIVPTYRADEKIARIRSVCTGGTHGKLFTVG